MASTDIATGTLERHGLSDEQLRDDFSQHAAAAPTRQSRFSAQPPGQGSVRARQRGARSAPGRRGDGVQPRQRTFSRRTIAISGSASASGSRPTRSCSRSSRAPRITTAAGNSRITTRPKRAGLMSFSSILAAHLPHAVGAAYAMQVSRRNRSRRPGDLRRRHDERRRVARVDELRGRPQAAVRDAGRK